MNIRLLGTGAADGIPGLFSDNQVSRYARENGGKDFRTRSAALVDGVLKIDLGPDTFCQLQRECLSARDWSGLVFTHSHEDHLAVSEIQYALYPFVEQDHLPFTIFGNATVLGLLRERYPHWPLDMVETRSFLTYTHGPYRITPVAATHTIGEDCHNLLIERRGKTILYATDTGVWPEETVSFLKHYRVNALIIECTDGFIPTTYHGHMDLETCVDTVNMLRKQGTLVEGARVVTTHHAHTGGARHCDLERVLCKHNMEPGYDGMFIEF
jgi:phosphoribosyl 1,2-cyclic phosphate phosphodiesterase